MREEIRKQIHNYTVIAIAETHIGDAVVLAYTDRTVRGAREIGVIQFAGKDALLLLHKCKFTLDMQEALDAFRAKAAQIAGYGAATSARSLMMPPATHDKDCRWATAQFIHADPERCERCRSVSSVAE